MALILVKRKSPIRFYTLSSGLWPSLLKSIMHTTKLTNVLFLNGIREPKPEGT